MKHIRKYNETHKDELLESINKKIDEIYDLFDKNKEYDTSDSYSSGFFIFYNTNIVMDRQIVNKKSDIDKQKIKDFFTKLSPNDYTRYQSVINQSLILLKIYDDLVSMFLEITDLDVETVFTNISILGGISNDVCIITMSNYKAFDLETTIRIFKELDFITSRFYSVRLFDMSKYSINLNLKHNI